MKTIYLASSGISSVNSPTSSIGVNLPSKANNIQQIGSRIEEHKSLVNKLKQKINI